MPYPLESCRKKCPKNNRNHSLRRNAQKSRNEAPVARPSAEALDNPAPHIQTRLPHTTARRLVDVHSIPLPTHGHLILGREKKECSGRTWREQADTAAEEETSTEKHRTTLSSEMVHETDCAAFKKNKCKAPGLR